MNNNIFQHNSSCVLGVTFSLTLEKAMVGDLGESLCLNKYWFCSLRKETLVSYYIYVINSLCLLHYITWLCRNINFIGNVSSAIYMCVFYNISIILAYYSDIS